MRLPGRLGLTFALAAALLGAKAAPSSAAPAAPDLVLAGSIGGAENETYRDVPFTVPTGVDRVTVQFDYTGREQRTTIDLGLFDGERFRGWSGGNKAEFTVSETDATPSYLRGPVRPGRWTLLLGVPNIRKGVTARFLAKVYFHRSGAGDGGGFAAAPLVQGARWYRGDLHMHTAHSDGSCPSQSGKPAPCPLFKTVEAAAAKGLDFIAITDHNTISHFDEERELQPYFDRLLLLPGREVTTFGGHANVFGPTDFIDFRLAKGHLPSVAALQAGVERVHGLMSVNHPASPSGEACMGCGWTAQGTDWSRVQAVEVVNGGSLATDGGNAAGPLSGVGFWEAQVRQGHRITAIGGSDNHGAGAARPSPIGTPTTVVYAAELSQPAILGAIRAGHVFIDVDGSGGRVLELTAASAGKSVMMGDALAAPAGAQVSLRVHAAGLAGGRVRLLADGAPMDLTATAPLGQDWEATAPWTSDGRRHWFRAEAYDPGGRLVLIGNPVYVNF